MDNSSSLQRGIRALGDIEALKAEVAGWLQYGDQKDRAIRKGMLNRAEQFVDRCYHDHDLALAAMFVLDAVHSESFVSNPAYAFDRNNGLAWWCDVGICCRRSRGEWAKSVTEDYIMLLKSLGIVERAPGSSWAYWLVGVPRG